MQWKLLSLADEIPWFTWYRSALQASRFKAIPLKPTATLPSSSG
jgi:hypothetical protein